MTSGFPVNIFVSPPTIDFNCLICHETLRDPKQCPKCGISFCDSCILKCFESEYYGDEDDTNDAYWIDDDGYDVNADGTCPNCRKYIAYDKLVSNLCVRNAIDSLDSYCMSCDNITDKTTVQHCAWIGHLSTRRSHYETQCEFKTVLCENFNCGMQLEKRQIEQHMSVCDYRLANCEHCHEQMSLVHIDEHDIYCEWKYIECPNGCDISLPRGQVSGHQQNECPLQKIDCPFNKLGVCSDSRCPNQLLRKDLSVHLSRFCERVCNKISKRRIELTSKLQCANDMVETLTTENTRLKNELDAIKQTWSKLTTLCTTSSMSVQTGDGHGPGTGLNGHSIGVKRGRSVTFDLA